jgi:tetratricopeptide (TPR) repeat protein
MASLGFRLSTVIALSAFAVWPVFAQRQATSRTTGNITGQVRYAQGGQPAFNVLVSCDVFSGGLIAQENTDRNGKFQFRNINLDQYVITVRLPGYIEERQTVELQQTPDQFLQILLRPEGSAKRDTPVTKVIDAKVPLEARKEFERGDEALASEKKERIQEGVRHLEKAVSLYPQFLQAQLKLGTAWMDLGEWAKAEQALRKVLELNPRTANALFAFGEIYRRQNKDDQAEKMLLQGLQIEDHSWQGHLTLGRVYWTMATESKDEVQARALFEKSYDQAKRALQLNPDFGDAHLLKGNLLLRAKRAQDALAEFEAYLSIEPKGEFADQTRTAVAKIKRALASQAKH